MSENMMTDTELQAEMTHTAYNRYIRYGVASNVLLSGSDMLPGYLLNEEFSKKLVDAVNAGNVIRSLCSGVTTKDDRIIQSDVWYDLNTKGVSPTMTNLQLIGAREAGKILGVNANMIYRLWHERKLDYWNIHGTMKTNMNAIADFLERSRNVDQNVQPE